MKTQTTTSPSVFITDYASYNNGTQFEFGHWVSLEDFSDEYQLNEYITKHFEDADEKSPLYGGTPREELMITDYEGFPEQFYSESGIDFEELYNYINLDDEDKVKFIYRLEQGDSVIEASINYDDVYLREWGGTFIEKVTHFEEMYPEAEEMSNRNDYVSIDYDRFIDDNYSEITVNGIDYLVDNF